MKLSIIRIFFISFIWLISLSGCSNDTSNRDDGNSTQDNVLKEINTYDQLLEAYENHNAILVRFDVSKAYTDKQLKEQFPSLAKLKITKFERNFNNGVLNKNGSLEYFGEVSWNVDGQAYHHDYKYIFMPSGKVNVNGNFSKVEKGSKDRDTQKLDLSGQLGLTVKVYAYK